jgi:outer membrane lipoprotein-sorting protein
LKTAAKGKVNGVDMTSTSTFSNYKKTPVGYTVAYTTFVQGEYDMTFTYSKVEFNQDIDPQTFAVPK